MRSTDDSALLRQFVENHSDAAFAALVTRHVNLVYSVALRQVGNRHHAEEITQAVFIVLAKKAAQLRHDKALSSWLFQTTRLTANNFIRSETRRHRREQEAHMQSVLNQSDSDVWPQIAPLLDAAVAGLSEKDRRVIVLRFYEGRNLRDVGAILGASEGAAEKRVGRAVEKLRTFFTKRGVTISAAAIAGLISTNSVQAAPAMLAKTVTAVAFAKGATASSSTLTLIKGASKVIAWADVKAAVPGLFVIFSPVISVLSSYFLIKALAKILRKSEREQRACEHFSWKTGTATVVLSLIGFSLIFINGSKHPGFFGTAIAGFVLLTCLYVWLILRWRFRLKSELERMQSEDTSK